jgi:hypothetical protein
MTWRAIGRALGLTGTRVAQIARGIALAKVDR